VGLLANGGGEDLFWNGSVYRPSNWTVAGASTMTQINIDTIQGRYAWAIWNGATGGVPPGPTSYVALGPAVALPRNAWLVFGMHSTHMGGDSNPTNMAGAGIWAWTIRNVTRSVQWNEATGTWTADGSITRDLPYTVQTDYRRQGHFWVPLNDAAFQDTDVYELRHVAQYSYTSSGTAHDRIWWLGPYHRRLDVLAARYITSTPAQAGPPRYI